MAIELANPPRPKRKVIPVVPPPPECPECTTPHKCGTQELHTKRGPRCVGKANGPDDCDCLNFCGDDPWLAKGKAVPCDHKTAQGIAARLKAIAGCVR